MTQSLLMTNEIKFSKQTDGLGKIVGLIIAHQPVHSVPEGNADPIDRVEKDNEAKKKLFEIINAETARVKLHLKINIHIKITHIFNEIGPRSGTWRDFDGISRRTRLRIVTQEIGVISTHGPRIENPDRIFDQAGKAQHSLQTISFEESYNNPNQSQLFERIDQHADMATYAKNLISNKIKVTNASLMLQHLKAEYASRKKDPDLAYHIGCMAFFRRKFGFNATQKFEAVCEIENKLKTHKEIILNDLPKAARQGRLGKCVEKLVAKHNERIMIYVKPAQPTLGPSA